MGRTVVIKNLLVETKIKKSIFVVVLKAEPSFHLLDFGALEKTLHESNKIFVLFIEHAPHVAKIQFRAQA